MTEPNLDPQPEPDLVSELEPSLSPDYVLPVNDSALPAESDMSQQVFHIFLILSNSLVFLTGIFGNVLVCYIVLTRKHMHNSTNLLHPQSRHRRHPAVFVGHTFTLLYTLIGVWMFGSLLCHAVPLAQAVSCFTSSLTLVAIAIDRYIVICHPLVQRMESQTCTIAILVIWLLSILFGLPYFVFLKYSPGEEAKEAGCYENWPSLHHRISYSFASCFLQFILPFLVIRSVFDLEKVMNSRLFSSSHIALFVPHFGWRRTGVTRFMILPSFKKLTDGGRGVGLMIHDITIHKCRPSVHFCTMNHDSCISSPSPPLV